MHHEQVDDLLRGLENTKRYMQVNYSTWVSIANTQTTITYHYLLIQHCATAAIYDNQSN